MEKGVETHNEMPVCGECGKPFGRASYVHAGGKRMHLDCFERWERRLIDERRKRHA